MTKLKVVITDYEYDSLYWEEQTLTKLDAEFIKCHCRNEEDLIAAVHDADAILVQYAQITRNVMAHMKKCRAIVRYGVGLDCIDLAAATEHGIMVANIPDYGLEDIADHVMALMLNCVRKITQLNQLVHEGKWDYKMAKPLYRLRGKTLGLVGFGNIARMAATKAKVFGMRPIAYDPYVDTEIARSYGVELVDFDTLLGLSDVLSLHVPVTEQTIHLINEDTLMKMKNTGILINTARGALVDEAALAKALENHQIAGAGLDVSEKEPINPDNDLLTLPNVIITPHSAWYTEEAQDSLQQQAAQEIYRVLTGDRPLNLANSQVLRKQ
ncbi:MAG: C-terminal binding protein [Syntrophomonadaceae bacterium]|jgi:D-3-phosphoglycerate dehydrogenase|nr:C-terminal binding protein [Syntrophomonadaceae bacterium]